MTDIHSVKQCAKECERSNRNLAKAVLLKLILVLQYLCSFSDTLYTKSYRRHHRRDCEMHDAFVRAAVSVAIGIELIGCLGIVDLIFAYGVLYTLKTAGVLMLVSGLYIWLVYDTNGIDGTYED